MNLFFKKIFQHKSEVNYLYFSFFLLFLSGLSTFHFLSSEGSLSGISLFFLFYAVGQAFLEVSLFVLVASFLKRWAPQWGYLFFISLSFVFLLFHFINFTLVRLMDVSISYLFKFLFGSGIDHFIVGLQALNMNGKMIAIIVGTVFLIPICGLGFYRLTHRLAHLRPMSLSFGQIGVALVSISLFLFVLDLLAHPFLNQLAYSKYQKILPFGTTFLSPTTQYLYLSDSIALPRNEKETLDKIPSVTLKSKPNVYLFIIETLRRDFIDKDTAPHLTSFAEENIQFPISFANANGTNLSWFSIFHSNFPFHWTAMRDVWKTGSIPLQFLKKLGYKIHVYSSADLHYFNMDRMIFGSERELADTIEQYTLDQGLQACDRDALAMEALKRDLQKEEGKEGNVYLIFLDSTHSEYSFPKAFPLQFEPISKEIDYLTIGPKSRKLELIKNRYRNSIYYIDHLMGHFFEMLKVEKLDRNGIIAITGDHGEEFFEEGALFHGTHLNRYQTSVPIFLKFPSKDWIPTTKEASHMDLFPSILHYLTGRFDFTSLFDGESLFSKKRWPYRLTVLQNGSLPTSEFSIEKKGMKLHARFANPSNIYGLSELEVIEIEGPFDSKILSHILNKSF